MPARVSFGRVLPNPIQTQLKSPISASSGKDSFFSAGLGAHHDTVIPSHDDARARTLILCFDGTGDQFDADVRTFMLSRSAHVLRADSVPFRIPILLISFLC